MKRVFRWKQTRNSYSQRAGYRWGAQEVHVLLAMRKHGVGAHGVTNCPHKRPRRLCLHGISIQAHCAPVADYRKGAMYVQSYFPYTAREFLTRTTVVVALFDPLPSWPLVFCPQHHTAPPLVRPQECAAPTAMSLRGPISLAVDATKLTALVRWSVVPSPSCRAAFAPQQ